MKTQQLVKFEFKDIAVVSDADVMDNVASVSRSELHEFLRSALKLVEDDA